MVPSVALRNDYSNVFFEFVSLYADVLHRLMDIWAHNWAFFNV